MKSLYIVGNGFDKAHGIKTDYWDFRSFLENEDYQFLQKFEELYNIHSLDPTEYGYSDTLQDEWNDIVYKELWSEFEHEIGFPNIQSMLDTSTSILNDLHLDGGNFNIIDTMNDYWKQQFGYIKKLQFYVNKWISQISLEGVVPKKTSIINNHTDYFLNFNYTTILEDIYHASNVIHIHGMVNDEYHTPFMGHCNSEQVEKHLQLYRDYLNKAMEGDASIHSAISDYLQEIYKDTSAYINQNSRFFYELESVNEVNIIGWSAGDVDIPYLRKVRDSVVDKSTWNVYYYGGKAYDSLHTAFSDNGIINSFRCNFIDSEKFWDYPNI